MVFPFLLASLVVLQLTLPRRLGFLPLVLATFHAGNVELISNLTPVRIVLLVGLCRSLFTASYMGINFGKFDFSILVFASVILGSSLFHSPSTHVPSPFVERAGLCLNIVGTYLYGRLYLSSFEALLLYCKCVALVLIPLSIFLGLEQGTGRNFYASMGARSEFAKTRNDRFRAQGPFGHAILAGTASASSLPLIIAVWPYSRRVAIVGLVACLLIVLASASSGPLATFAIAASLLYLWRFRSRLVQIKRLLLLSLIILHFSMNRPIWFLMARIDIVGGSTGWHRSALIDSAISHLDEWWLAGTDYTRHWMPSGVSWNPDQTDLTNYYIHIGATAGLLAVIILVLLIYLTTKQIGQLMESSFIREYQFLYWCIGVAVLAHAITFLSVSYFGQMFSVFYILIGAIASQPKFDGQSNS